MAIGASTCQPGSSKAWDSLASSVCCSRRYRTWPSRRRPEKACCGRWSNIWAWPPLASWRTPLPLPGSPGSRLPPHRGSPPATTACMQQLINDQERQLSVHVNEAKQNNVPVWSQTPCRPPWFHKRLVDGLLRGLFGGRWWGRRVRYCPVARGRKGVAPAARRTCPARSYVPNRTWASLSELSCWLLPVYQTGKAWSHVLIVLVLDGVPAMGSIRQEQQCNSLP